VTYRADAFPDLAPRLKKYRIEHEWTFRQAGSVIGIAPSAVSKIENGKCKPNEITVYKIKKAIPALFDEKATA